jgi:hypothetical protein
MSHLHRFFSTLTVLLGSLALCGHSNSSASEHPRTRTTTRSPLRIIFSFCLFLSVVANLGTARAADPTTADCLAASESSVALRNQHKLRDARAQLLTCSAATCPTDVRDECVRRVADVSAAMPTLVFEVKNTAGEDLVAVTVTMDGTLIASRLEGTALSIDPGAHSFTFETAGQPPVEKQFVIHEGEKDRRERVTLGAAPPPSVGSPQAISAQPSSSDTPSRKIGSQRIAAIGAAGVGVVGLVLGTAFGLDAISKHNDAKKTCPAQCADQSGVNLWNQAVSAGNISTVGFIVGVVGLGAGAALWFTAKPSATDGHDTASTQVGFGPGSVQLRGTW